jgi:hypothetical protein
MSTTREHLTRSMREREGQRKIFSYRSLSLSPSLVALSDLYLSLVWKVIPAAPLSVADNNADKYRACVARTCVCCRSQHELRVRCIN